MLDPDGGEVADDSAPLTVLPGESATARTRLAVAAARLWSPESPTLYTVVTTLADEEGAVFDEDRTDFGIRRLQLDPAAGPPHQRRRRQAARRMRAP